MNVTTPSLSTEQTLTPGTYSVCSCGLSAQMPRCDGAHKGTRLSPYRIKIEPGHCATLKFPNGHPLIPRSEAT